MSPTHFVPRFRYAAILGALAMALAFNTNAQTKKEIKISHSQPATEASELQLASLVVSHYIQDHSDTLTARIYPANALGEERAVYEAMQLGSGATCVITGTAILNDFSKRIGLVDLPYMWRDYDHMRKTLNGPVGDALAKDLEKSGFKLVEWMTNWGFRNVITAKKVVKTPEDLKGLKIRTIQSSLYVDTLKMMGTNATPMAFGEVYTSMQTGVLDGLEHGSSIIVTQKFYEVAKHIALTRHFLGPVAMVCSLQEWNKLNDKEKQTIQEGARLASDINWALAPQREQQAFDYLKTKGMDVNEIDVTSFREGAKAIQDKFAKANGAEELLAMIRSANK